MNNEIEKLKDQIRALGEALDHETYPLQSLMIEQDWSDADFDRAHDIFEKYDTILQDGGSFTHHDIEADFDANFGFGYQTVKSVVLGMYRAGKWTNVCVVYAQSMTPIPVELKSIK